MNQPVLDRVDEERRKGVKRTVTICLVVVLVFFLISFVQIVMMK